MLFNLLMKTINEKRRERLTELIKSYGSSKKFAEHIDKSPSQVSQWLKGSKDSKTGKQRGMSDDSARYIEEMCGKKRGWMDSFTSSGQSMQAGETSHDANVTQGPQFRSEVPLISWVTAGDWCEAIDNFQPGDADTWVSCPFDGSENIFCLEVRGPSMNPEYRDGEIICVDPAVEAGHNDDVIVRDQEGNATFKRLQITSDGTYLLALCPDWPERMIKIPPESHICGVVIGSWMSRKK